jgi:hypothetical protein
MKTLEILGVPQNYTKIIPLSQEKEVKNSDTRFRSMYSMMFVAVYNNHLHPAIYDICPFSSIISRLNP